ncbi:sigma-54-dependent transcriptional regulator [Azospirillum agricola]|uniref:sigma-54-dependent transcriptional regulator n=1 Tax=Azospirillum agricola TaxID=1720247 RepID=UPI000A0F1DD4|nr:sigma-54 dependent transcriptional regulator [Azospirillum agricola]SMH33908.1 DNA-binding transcriptional response regulator, NtrC family, contains REC, AAA-type ATPase, and a Fis-type DNA-binding domains [Azospirillum lipoferum]
MTASPRPGILVVDDEPRSVEVIARVLDEDFDVHTALSAEEALRLLETEWIQIVFSDQRMPEVSGVEFLTEVRERWPEVVRIVITGYIDPEDIIGAINTAGIHQFITKPWHPDHLLLTARNAARLYQLQREHDRLSGELKLLTPVAESRVVTRRERVAQHYRFDSLVRAPGSPVDAVCRKAAQVAGFNVPVLVLGETGTGKELLARAIHYGSPRSDRPFYAENCGAIPDELLESELFGHKKGAFTGAHSTRIGLLEQADGGTIFLDEIGDISPAFQVKLLRFLQEGEIRPVGSNETRTVDVRVLAATHRDLPAEVRAGRFREDLYYRLATMTLTMPPLRDRPADIPVLARNLLDRLSAAHGKPVAGFTDETLACLEGYGWPGNVRELQNEIMRMLVLCEGDRLGAELLSDTVLRGAAMSAHAPPAGTGGDAAALEALAQGGPLKTRIERVEAGILLETLVRCRWNKSRAADELGLSRMGLRAKLERYGIERAATAQRH